MPVVGIVDEEPTDVFVGTGLLKETEYGVYVGSEV
jgi:hypothetical protein